MVFTGLVQAVGSATRDEKTCLVRVRGPTSFFSSCALGDSIAVNGVCLTLVEGWDKDTGLFFVMEETRQKTNLFRAENNNTFPVNLEKSLSHGNYVGGHYVLGHVQGLGTIQSIQAKQDGSWDVWIDISGIPQEIRNITYKGCIAIDGISLTVAELSADKFRVSLIPHTITHTVFCHHKVGDLVNIEFDSTQQQQQQQQTKQYYSDEDIMLEAVKQGERGRYTAPPNPWVGCVLAKDGEIIGMGYHVKAGQPHAEINAIHDAEAKGNAHKIKGCTVYVTLEPCHHFGRTPPCDAELVKREVSRVVVAVADPDLRVKGNGINLLQQHNITVTLGVLRKEAERSLEPYLYHRTTGKPFVVIKAALSLDGRIACEDGTSQWITGPTARHHVHQLRAASQAIVVGSGTVLTDNPKLTVRGLDFDHGTPLRVVLDARGRVKEGHVLDTSEAPTLIYTTSKAPQSTRDIWQKAGVEFKLISPSKHGLTHTGVDLTQVIQDLGARGILSVMIEGGGVLQNSFIFHSLCNNIVFYYGGCLIGETGKSWAQRVFSSTIKKTKFWKLLKVTQLGDDFCVEYDTTTSPSQMKHSNL